MGVVYLAYCGSWQLSLHIPCFCAFYIFNTTPNPTSSSFFQNVFVLVQIRNVGDSYWYFIGTSLGIQNGSIKCYSQEALDCRLIKIKC